MTRRRRSAFLTSLLLSLLLFAAPSTSAASIVRGRLFRVVSGQTYPAQGIGVTVFNPQLGRSTPSYSGPDGMYYLYNIPPGSYNLAVWTSDPPMVFQIQVGTQPYTDIAPIQVP
jgi:hypothetical protein